MKNSKKTRRALISSLLSLVVCVSMLVGSTYAWFTDTASAGVNTIQSGTLDVDLVNEAGDSLEGTTLAFKTADNRDTAILWEPGCTYVLDPVYVKNNGNLALKYKIVVNGIDGDAKLLEAIEWTVNIGTVEGADLSAFEGHLTPAASLSDAIVISGHMKEEAGNEYQNLTANGIGITVYATQDTVEYDSFNNTYDANASLDFTEVANTAAFSSAIAEGGNVSVTNNITTSERVQVVGDTTIQGNGNTIAADANDNRVLSFDDTTVPTTLNISGATIDATNAKKDSAYQRGISIYGNTDATVNLDNSTVKSGWYAINVAGANDSVLINADDTTLDGWAAVNIWSPTTLVANRSTLKGTNDKTYNADGWNDFATIVVNPGATNTSLTFNNCRIEASATTGNQQWLVLLEEEGVHLTFNNCTFVYNGTEISAEEMLENHFAVTSQAVLDTAVVTIDGTVVALS